MLNFSCLHLYYLELIMIQECHVKFLDWTHLTYWTVFSLIKDQEKEKMWPKEKGDKI